MEIESLSRSCRKEKIYQVKYAFEKRLFFWIGRADTEGRPSERSRSVQGAPMRVSLAKSQQGGGKTSVGFLYFLGVTSIAFSSSRPSASAQLFKGHLRTSVTGLAFPSLPHVYNSQINFSSLSLSLDDSWAYTHSVLLRAYSLRSETSSLRDHAWWYSGDYTLCLG